MITNFLLVGQPVLKKKHGTLIIGFFQTGKVYKFRCYLSALLVTFGGAIISIGGMVQPVFQAFDNMNIRIYISYDSGMVLLAIVHFTYSYRIIQIYFSIWNGPMSITTQTGRIIHRNCGKHHHSSIDNCIPLPPHNALCIQYLLTTLAGTAHRQVLPNFNATCKIKLRIDPGT
ncbi:hypothetical protein ES705_14035 [subsurface metagenome]